MIAGPETWMPKRLSDESVYIPARKVDAESIGDRVASGEVVA
jgi:hypothetical protein